MTARRPGHAHHAPRYAPDADRGEDWRDQALCIGHDPELWFPLGHTAPAIAQARDAQAVCFDCPVVDPCREWAIDTRQHYGIWGGLTEAERDTIIRGRRRGTRTREEFHADRRDRAAQQTAEAVRLRAEGRTTAEIASSLDVTAWTVSSYLRAAGVKDFDVEEAVRLRAQGLSYRAIGEALGVDRTTISTRLAWVNHQGEEAS